MLTIFSMADWVWPGERPTVFGWYHIMWLIIMIISCVVVSLTLSKKRNKKIDENFIFAVGLGLVILEVLKQCFKVCANGYFNWNDVPLQFCSIPIFVAFTSKFIKNQKIKETLYGFLATYGFLAGLLVMIYPGSVYNTDYLPMLIHSMIWHTAMVIMGLHLIISRSYGKNIKELYAPTILLVGLVFSALIINIIAQGAYFGIPGVDFHGDFNLFYISPYYDCPLPILGDVIKENLPFPVFFVVYLIAFILGVLLVWGIVYCIKKVRKH